MSDSLMPFDRVGGETDVVMDTEDVGEAEVDKLDLVFLDQIEHFLGGGHRTTSASD